MQGDVLGGWRIESELGSGAMGTVYRARTVEAQAGLAEGTEVALKVIHPHLLGTERFVKRFLREGAIGRDVQHPNVVRTYACDVAQLGSHLRHYLVMERVEGQNLRDLLDELGTAPERLCRHVGREIARGLEAIHAAGVVHRDLKPENVLITPENDVKIMDLGVARLQDEAIRLSQTGAFAGSIGYAAPEQFGRQDEGIDGRVDLHALGVVLYELSTGRHPFGGGPMREVLRRILEEEPRRLGALQPQLSPFFEEVVHTLLAKSRDARFGAARELSETLAEGERSSWWTKRVVELRRKSGAPLRRIRIPRETALYGRDDELAALRAAFERARAGRGQVRLLRGEAGVGKTRLVDEFVAQLRQGGEEVNFLFGAYPPGGAATAAGAFSIAYREHFGTAGLEDSLKSYLKATPTLIPAFAALLRGEPLPAGASSLTTDSLPTTFIHATRRLAAERPTILLVDDLHFAPEAGRALFASLARALSSDAVLLIGTLPPAGFEGWAAPILQSDHATPLQLPRLEDAHLRPLLVEAFRSSGLADDLLARLSEKSQGNPLFLFEILGGLKESGHLTLGTDGRWSSTQEIRSIDVPSSVADLVRARVGTLDPEERNLLDVASCLGVRFDPELVAAVSGRGPIPTYKALAHVERAHHLVRSAGRQFTFDHHLVQEALYKALHPLLREEYHAELAEALEAKTAARKEDRGANDGAIAVALCEHFLKGGKPERAQERLDEALDHLEEGYAHDGALDLVNRALAAPGLLVRKNRCGILLRKADRLDRLGRREAQAQALGEAERLARDLDDPNTVGQVYLALARHASQLARHEEAGKHARRALTTCQAAGLRSGEAAALSVLGVRSLNTGQLEKAYSLFERARGIAHELGDVASESRMTGNLGSVLRYLGRNEEARELFEQRLALASESGDREGEATALGNLGVLFKSLGEYDAAREHHQRHLDLARQIGDRHGQARAIGNLGNVYAALGDHAVARDHYERHLAMAREIGDRQGEARAHANLGLVARELGHHATALTHYERQLEITRAVGDRLGEARGNGLLGSLLQALGRLAESGVRHRRQLELARDMRDRWSECRATGSLGVLDGLLGRPDDARVHLEGALARARELGERRLEGSWLHALGDLDVEQGDASSARDRYEQALAIRHEIENRRGEARTLLALGALGRQVDRLEEARQCLGRALELARVLDAPDATVLALAHLALLDGGDVETALDGLREHGHRLEHRGRMEALHLLWQATGDPRHLEEARRLLRELRDRAPSVDQEAMMRDVLLYRDIARAHEERVPGS